MSEVLDSANQPLNTIMFGIFGGELSIMRRHVTLGPCIMFILSGSMRVLGIKPHIWHHDCGHIADQHCAAPYKHDHSWVAHRGGKP